MLVFHLVCGNGGGWHGLAFPPGRIIMTCPDLDVVRQGQYLLGGLVQITSTSTGKITSGRANVDVEQRVTAKDVVYFLKSARTKGGRRARHADIPPIRYPRWSGVWPGRWMACTLTLPISNCWSSSSSSSKTPSYSAASMPYRWPKRLCTRPMRLPMDTGGA